jgi:hypothetical protein
MRVDFREVSYRQSLREAVFWFIFWIILCAVAVLIPYGLGALIPLFALLATIKDVESTTTAPATFGAFITMLLALGINDVPAAGLYFLAVVLGLISLVSHSR